MGKYKKLEKRLNKIEKHLGLNTEVTVSKMESVEELPEKWCYKASEEMKTKLANYYKEKFGKDLRGLIWMYVNSENHILSSYVLKGFNVITDDQFKKWVLKEDENNTVGNNDATLSIREVQVKVSSQEEANECAEIVKARGEEIWDNELYNYVSETNNYFQFNGDDFAVHSYEKKLKEISIQEFRERFGKAVLSKTETTEIDWSKAGQLVTDGHFIVITNGEHLEDYFSGSVVKKDDNFNIGNFFKNNPKSEFKICTEPITLSNERN